MANPKKKVSKSKTKSRFSKWKSKGVQMAKRALSLGKSIINKKSKFLFDPKKKESKDTDKNLPGDTSKTNNSNDNPDKIINNDRKN